MNFGMKTLVVIMLSLISYVTNAFEITQVTTNSVWLKEKENEKLQISFSIPESATIQLKIFDGRDLLVGSVSSTMLDAGHHDLTWNLKDLNDSKVPNGIYHYTLEAVPTNKDSEANVKKVIYDLTDLTGAKRVGARQVEWNAEETSLSYVLPATSLVNIRVGLKDGGPLMKTLVDWLPRPAGVNTEEWNGYDHSGHINLGKHAMRDISVLAYSFSDNSILIGSDFTQENFIEFESQKIINRESPANVKKKTLRALPVNQSPDSRGDVIIELSLPDEYKKNKQGFAIINGKVPFRLDVNKADKVRASNLRFEAAFYVDGLKVYENEIGFLPMTWYWDTSNVNPGTHYITANLIGYEGSFGIETMKVEVE